MEKGSGINVRFNDYLLDSGIFGSRASEIVDTIDLRQNQFSATAEYQEVISEFSRVIDKLREMYPEEERELIKLDDIVTGLEVICFTAGYKNGMADLMTAMNFNKAGFTNVACIDYGDEEPKALTP
ncbi:MAG: hypothetical protein GX881_07555 [Firmicutes bacterium]|nr:hypothetical protein [Bacillota bacterium]